MKPSSSYIPLPSFQRLSEAVVYCTLERLCRAFDGHWQGTLAALARHSGLAPSTARRAVHALATRQHIHYRPGCNQYQPSSYALSTRGGAELSPNPSAAPKSGAPIPSDTYRYTYRVSIGDRNERKAFHNGATKNLPSSEERFAHQLAEGLDDLQNVKLYRSYVRRFPSSLLLKAYLRAKEPHPQKIRKSRGALFNYLVQRYVRTKNNKHHDPGSASR